MLVSYLRNFAQPLIHPPPDRKTPSRVYLWTKSILMNVKHLICSEKHIKVDKFLLPMASLEMGLTKMNADSYSEAKCWLKKAKDEYSGYLFETMIHFRAHSALQRSKSLLKAEKSETK